MENILDFKKLFAYFVINCKKFLGDIAMKKKLVLLLSMLIGIVFVYVGFSALQTKEEAVEAQEQLNYPANENSADALENIAD